MHIQALNLAPFFELSPHITLLEASSWSEYAGFASNISAGRDEEAHQKLSFSILLYDTQHLFDPSQPPVMSTEGTLSFMTIAGAYGTADLHIRLLDNEGAMSIVKQTTIFVLPLPVILSVNPVVLPMSGGNIGIVVKYLELPASLAPAVPQSSLNENVSVSIMVGDITCPIISRRAVGADAGDELLTCAAAAGVGGGVISVSVTSGLIVRQVLGPHVVFSHVIAAGMRMQGITTTQDSYVALGPQSTGHRSWPPTLGAGLLEAPVRFLSGFIPESYPGFVILSTALSAK